MTPVAFIGLGAMGSRMAAALLAAGFPLTVYNRNPERARPLEAKGAARADSPREAAAQADIVISMVTDEHASRSVWLDDKRGAIHGLRAGAVAIESSTLTPAWARTLAGEMTRRDVAFLDAPVAGTRPHAEAHQLIHLVGGEARALERAREVLATMSSAIHHVGAAGNGMLMKLAVNAILGIQTAAIAEALTILGKAGVDPEKALEILGALPIASPAMMRAGGLMAARNFAPNFPIDLVQKDFAYLLKTTDSVNMPAPLATAVQALCARANQAGLGDEDIAAIARVYDMRLTDEDREGQPAPG
ncbi:MAG: NAD(P)-dependent oxidoreductase [Gammaproteobacteria bacterium]